MRRMRILTLDTDRYSILKKPNVLVEDPWSGRKRVQCALHVVLQHAPLSVMIISFRVKESVYLSETSFKMIKPDIFK